MVDDKDETWSSVWGSLECKGRWGEEKRTSKGDWERGDQWHRWKIEVGRYSSQRRKVTQEGGKWSGCDCAYSWCWLIRYRLMENFETYLYCWLYLWKKLHLFYSYIHMFNSPHFSFFTKFLLSVKKLMMMYSLSILLYLSFLL